jgi:hypothetical protein
MILLKIVRLMKIMKISSTKKQISNKSQIPNSKRQTDDMSHFALNGIVIDTAGFAK